MLVQLQPSSRNFKWKCAVPIQCWQLDPSLVSRTRLVQIPLEIVKPKKDYAADSLVFDENHLNIFFIGH